ncbi:hypothetical protein WAF17_07105 [Bernardetia sp. ABR2-2B]|uniref:hypothetical protein n=1 Tax=Bernardetia sp. ABR2-2B TaxID=3127472 RepID=UPI0030CBDAEE
MNINNNIQQSNTESSFTKPSSLKPVFPPSKRPPEEQPLAQNLHKSFIDTPTHFETDYISMKWIPEKRRIDVIWKQFVSEEKVREVLLKEVAMIRHTKVKCLFLDAQKFKGTNPNIPRWANEVWSQMVHDAGLQHFATVVSDKDIFAVFSLKYGMGEKLTSLVNCAVFKTIEEGEVWLRQYTHPESPVYSDDELEELMEEYENLKANVDAAEIENIHNQTENVAQEKNEIEEEKELTEPSRHPMNEIKKEERIVEIEATTTKTREVFQEEELQSFDLENEKQTTLESVEDSSEDKDEAENDKRLSQIQVFSNFEDLENHIQGIESKYKVDEDTTES